MPPTPAPQGSGFLAPAGSCTALSQDAVQNTPAALQHGMMVQSPHSCMRGGCLCLSCMCYNAARPRLEAAPLKFPSALDLIADFSPLRPQDPGVPSRLANAGTGPACPCMPSMQAIVVGAVCEGAGSAMQSSQATAFQQLPGRTWVYLSMKSRALGTLWSPRWMTEDPTQPPMRCWHLHRMPRMARPTESAACTLFMPCPVLTSLQAHPLCQAGLQSPCVGGCGREAALRLRDMANMVWRREQVQV